MRRSFLSGTPDRFTDDQKTAVLALARADGGTCLTDVMTALNLGRTAAISLLGQLTEAQTLYSVPNPARRHLRYFVNEDEIRPHLLDLAVQPQLLTALAAGPGSAAHMAERLRLPGDVPRANLEALREQAALFGPRGVGARVYHLAQPAAPVSAAVQDGPAA